MSEKCECTQEGRIVILEQQDISIKEGLHQMLSKTDLILAQLGRVAVLEANHSHQSETMTRAFAKITAVETDMKSLTDFMNKAKGMAQFAYIIWGALGAGVFMLFIKVLFFMGNNGVTP